MKDAGRYCVYPMDRLKRVASPTVRIAGEIKQVREDENGYNRAVRGDFGSVVQRERPRFVAKYPLGAALRCFGEKLGPLMEGDVAPQRAPLPDSSVILTEHIRRLGYFLRVDVVGICRVPRYAVYSHDKHGNEVELDHKYAVVLVVDQEYDTMNRSTGSDWISGSQSHLGYSFTAVTACIMADYIRRLGYPARAHYARDYQVLIPPLLLWAGIGEHCRMGNSVLNPFIGARFKAAAVTTDLPLVPDGPVDFGLQAFCAQCGRCADECPAKAIPAGEKTVYNGREVWKLDEERCTRFRLSNQRGSSCGRCIKVCGLLLRQERIERTLARRHLMPGGFVLYDLSSSYFEGRSCPLAALGHSRDGKKGTLQITYGLVCSPEGRPVSVTVFSGNTQDQQTLAPAVASVTTRFGIERVIFVGDRGMITQAHTQTLGAQGVGFISALKSPQVKALAASGELQLSLFDETNLAEIRSREFPGERLVVCRNPAVAAERRRKRGALLAATEAELGRVKAMVENPRGRLRHADAGTIGERVGRVSNRYKMAKHFELRIAEGAFSFARKEDEIEKEAALDGLYVLRTTCRQEELGTRAVVRAYKQLKVAERAFRQMKSPELLVRPIYHHLEERVRAHVFLCMLAYYVAFELRERLAPLLFSDDTPLAPADPVAPAERSPAGKANAGSKLTADGFSAHSLSDLLAELGTLCRNSVRIEPGGHTFTQLTNPTALQTRAFELLKLRP